jgi:undecaprenyl-diphosphatase
VPAIESALWRRINFIMMRNKLSLAIGIGVVLSIVTISFALGTDRQPGDLSVGMAVQDLPGGAFGNAMDFGNGIGSFWGLGLIGLVLIAVMLLRRRPAEAAFVFAGGLWYVASPLLKNLIERPRPTSDELFVQFEQAGYSFPSSHVFGATIVLGAVLLLSGVCFRSNRLFVQSLRFTAVAIFIVIALSRIYLGQHLPSDLIGAFVISATGMAIIYALFRHRYAHFGKAQPIKG